MHGQVSTSLLGEVPQGASKVQDPSGKSIALIELPRDGQLWCMTTAPNQGVLP